jgi:hypothetical protein
MKKIFLQFVVSWGYYSPPGVIASEVVVPDRCLRQTKVVSWGRSNFDNFFGIYRYSEKIP